ncbi:MAG: C45 family autoproteolytic acyltransferase/hydrolase, partial [Myxococcota bacterium]
GEYRTYTLDARAPDDRRYGPNRLARVHGLWVARVEGSAYEIGRALSELAGPLAVRNEDALVREFYAHVPGWPVRWALVRGVPFLAGPMVEGLPPAYPEEVRGIADVGADPWGWVAPAFTRKLCYHAIHDVGQAMVDGPLLACTGFAAGGARTRDGRWLLARNFDFDGGRFFDEDKAVVAVARDGAIPFVHVAILGLSGVVSGLNAEGLAVAVLAGASDAPVRAGAPMIFAVREVLESARTIGEARAVLERRRGFVSEGILVVDGRRGEAAVLEVTPDDVTVLPATGDAIALSNHFRGAHAYDLATLRRRAEGTSVARLARMEELLATAPPLDDVVAASLLRDREGPGGRDLPDGHEAAVDADVASHGAVVDATARTILVSTWPNLAGGWVRFSLDDLLAGELRGELAVPARDPERTLRVHEARRLQRIAREQAPAEAIATLDRALALVPGDPRALVARGKARRAAGLDGDADLRAALAVPPARAAEVREIEALLAR